MDAADTKVPNRKPKHVILRLPSQKSNTSSVASNAVQSLLAIKDQTQNDILRTELTDRCHAFPILEDSELRPSESLAEELECVIAPPVNSWIAACDPELNFPRCLMGRYREDEFFKWVLENPTNFTEFYVKKDLVFWQEGMSNVLCIPNVKIQNKNAHKIIIDHAHSILAHLVGPQKTLSYLQEQVWWKEMVQDINKFCNTCHICKTAKLNNQRPYGLLRTLPVPFKPWDGIGVDFVGPLPESKNCNGMFNTICVIIDLLTSMVHLVPSQQTFHAKDVVELMFDCMYKLHGLLSYIVSNRDLLFTSVFWDCLHYLIGVKLKLSSTYHPQTDGSTECANRTITQMLRMCVNAKQKDWAVKLPTIKFTMNNTRSKMTGFAPFFLYSGRMPRPMIWENPESSEFPGVCIHAQQMKDMIMSAHNAMLAAHVKQTVSANRMHRPAPFEEGDLVYISTKNLNLPKNRA